MARDGGGNSLSFESESEPALGSSVGIRGRRFRGLRGHFLERVVLWVELPQRHFLATRRRRFLPPPAMKGFQAFRFLGRGNGGGAGAGSGRAAAT